MSVSKILFEISSLVDFAITLTFGFRNLVKIEIRKLCSSLSKSAIIPLQLLRKIPASCSVSVRSAFPTITGTSCFISSNIKKFILSSSSSISTTSIFAVCNFLIISALT